MIRIAPSICIMRNLLGAAALLLVTANSLGEHQTDSQAAAKGANGRKRSEGVVEVGEIKGVPFRIDVPEGWSGGLVMYCRSCGGPSRYGIPGALAGFPGGQLAAFLQRGFAVAQSGFSEPCWPLDEGIHETEALRRYFVQKYGVPKEVYVTGHSSGGLLAMALVETFPDVYDGGLSLGGINAPMAWILERREFDSLVVFDYYFPGVLPPLDKIPVEYNLSADRIHKLLKEHPEHAETLRRFSGLRTNEDLAKAFSFYPASLANIQRRAHGNPCDNRNTIYSGTSDDNAVNDRVKRYAANPTAVEYLRRCYTPTGVLKKPLLSMHCTYDLYVPGWVMNAYSTIHRQAGGPDFFVQQYVKRDGHCVFTVEEVGLGFDQLRQWRLKGVRPAAGMLK
ncbi:MAG: alpha/beta fold hydrolase [Candidatus Hydrogenedentes bacterium]|nr:alpha/beta fold hydrolase [Candidatus Hydrogenedentota bacterium]